MLQEIGKEERSSGQGHNGLRSFPYKIRKQMAFGGQRRDTDKNEKTVAFEIRLKPGRL